MVAAFSLRLFGIVGLPYNYDEPRNIEIIESIDPAHGELPLRSFQHPPLSVYVLRFGVALFGSNNFGYRSMNALVGALSVAMIYLLAARGFGDTRVGLLAALFLATSRFHIGWSRLINQEVLYLAWVTLSLLLFWRVVRRDSGYTALALGLGLAVLTKELAVLLVPALLLYLATGAEGRALLRRGKLWLAVASVGLISMLLFAYAASHPDRGEMNLGQNLYRARSLGISVEPLEFFLSPSTTHDAPLADAWTYPSMYRLTGVLLLAGVLASIRSRRDPFTRLMLVVFGFYFCFFTFVGTDMSRAPFHQGEFWWVDVAIVPAIVLTSSVLIDLAGRSPALGRWFWAVPVYLVVNALFFVATTKGSPILEALRLTYDDLVTTIPFLM